jgi:vitamin B12 transporter
VDEIFGVGRVALDNYGVFDISGAYSISDSFEAFVRLENAFDEDYQEVSGFNSPGRAGYGGIRMRF